MVLSARPSVVKAVIPVDLPRLRALSVKRQPALLARVDEIWWHIEAEVRSGLLTREARGPAGPTAG